MSNCRRIHPRRTPHTHPSLSQSAAHRHSQTADQRQNIELKLNLERWYLRAGHVQSRSGISTWHRPLRQAAVMPKGGGLSDSQRVPSTNWEPRLTIKFSPCDWHMYRHCSSPVLVFKDKKTFATCARDKGFVLLHGKNYLYAHLWQSPERGSRCRRRQYLVAGREDGHLSGNTALS